MGFISQNMRKVLIIIVTFLLLVGVANAQDKIKTKEGSNLTVKIIYVDKDYIYFYQPSNEPKKTIRRIPKNIVAEYEYLSIEGGKNREVVKSDSMMFVEYLNTQADQPYRQSINYSGIAISNEKINSNTKVDNTIKNEKIELSLPVVNRKFRNAGKCMLISNGLTISALIFAYASNNVTLPDNPTADDFKKAIHLQTTYQNISMLSGIASFGFMVGAGINIYTGAVYLK
jgi:hypothetical protein